MSDASAAAADTPEKNIRPETLAADFVPTPQTHASLLELAQRLEQRATSFIHWYLDKKAGPKRWSQSIRVLAIVLTTLGGLCPLFSSFRINLFGLVVLDSGLINQWGYIFIALAGALVLADRYLGCSSSWMRYMTTQMALQRCLERFQLNWAIWRIQNGRAQDALGADQVSRALHLLSDFQDEVSELVDQEFKAWISDFKEQLSSLQNSTAKGKDEDQTGTLIVSLDTPAEHKGLRQISVDNQPHAQGQDNTFVLSGLSPGQHLVQAQVESDGGGDGQDGPRRASQTVHLNPGQVASLRLTGLGSAVSSR
jgi:hypothetical protein